MATLVTGLTINIGDVVASQSLHDMIEGATIAGLGSDDLLPGSQFLIAAGATPDPASFKFWYDASSYTDPVVRVFHPGASIWLAWGPDRVEIPLIAAEPIFLGAQLVSAGPSLAGLATSGASFSPVGFAQASAASGRAVPVGIYGYMVVAWNSATTGHRTPSMGEMIHNRFCPAGYVSSMAHANNSASGTAFGLFVDEFSSPAPGTLFRAYVWGGCRATADPA
jgi:hypothetical protein